MSQTPAIPNPLGTERIGKLLFQYSVPSIISIVVNSLYNTVDQIFIGQAVGYLGNAATTIVLPLTTMLLALGMMVGNGAAAYISLSLGKGRPEEAANSVGNSVTLTVAISVLLTILCEVFMQPLCYLFGATPDSLSYCITYGRIIVLGFPVAFICAAFGGVIRADGRPNASMIGLLIGCGTNIVLDALFVMGFHWGIAGAAWATIIGQLFNAIYFAWCLLRCRTFQLKKSYFRLKPRMVQKICTLGTSSFISQIAMLVVITAMNNSLVVYGAASKYGADIPLAALGITIKVSMIISGIAFGIAFGVQPIFGYNYGSGQYDRVKKAFKLALIWCVGILLVADFIFQVFPGQIVLIFGQESELYMEFAIKCFHIYLLMVFMLPASGLTGVLFQSIGQPLTATLLSLSRQIIILLPSILIFGRLWGVEGLLWAAAFSDTLSGIIALTVTRIRWNSIFAKGGAAA